MNDLAISKALALAIGYLPEHVYIFTHHVLPTLRVITGPDVHGTVHSREFDYRDPAVIWPIAERYDAFPTRLGPFWYACADNNGAGQRKADTAAKAVAMAVIGSR